MSVQQLLRWQWSDYAAKHRSRANLLIHIVAVPLFQVGTFPGVSRIAILSNPTSPNTAPQIRETEVGARA